MSIPFGELEDGLMHMYAAGYRPNSVRPYWFRSQLFATVCWNRSRRRYHWQADMTADELQRQHDLLKRESLELWDMADYQVDGQVRFVGLWLQSPTSEPLDTVLRLEQDGKEDRRGLYQLRTDGYSLHRYLSRIDEQGIRRYSSLWKPSVTSGRDDRSYSAYFGGIDFATTAQAITDCRILVLDPTRPQLFDLFETAAAGVQMLPNEQPVDRIITEAFAKYQTGQLDEALREINIAMGNSPQNLELIYLRGKLFVALGDVQGVRHTASLIALAGRLPYHAAYFRLRAYLLEGNSTAARRCLAELAQAYVRREQRDSPRLRYAYSSALTALAAALRETDPTASADFRGQAIQVFAEAHDVSWTHAGAVFREFDVLRTDERFLQLIAEAGWDGLISLSYIADPSVTSRWLPFMPVAEHDAESEQLADEGWTPQCTTVAYAPARRQLLAGSVWNRHAPSTKNVVTVSRPQANLALLLAAMGNEAYVTKVLDGEFGQELASHLMARAATADVNPELLLRVLADATQVPRRYQQVLCALSRYPLPRIPEPSRAELLARLNRLAVDEPNAGLRSAAIACLRNWAGRDAHPLLDFDPASLPPQNPIVEDRIRDWYRNAAGQTMIVVAPPETFAMGSSASDSERWSNEWTQNRYLNSRYALSATEVTARQYRRFLDDPKVKDFYASQAQRPSAEGLSRRKSTMRDFLSRCRSILPMAQRNRGDSRRTMVLSGYLVPGLPNTMQSDVSNGLSITHGSRMGICLPRGWGSAPGITVTTRNFCLNSHGLLEIPRIKPIPWLKKFPTNLASSTCLATSMNGAMNLMSSGCIPISPTVFLHSSRLRVTPPTCARCGAEAPERTLVPLGVPIVRACRFQEPVEMSAFESRGPSRRSSGRTCMSAAVGWQPARAARLNSDAEWRSHHCYRTRRGFRCSYPP